MYTDVYIYIYGGGGVWKLMQEKSYLPLTFLTNEIQALQHQRKKCVDSKQDYAEK